jgi:hypothetical protein
VLSTKERLTVLLSVKERLGLLSTGERLVLLSTGERLGFACCNALGSWERASSSCPSTGEGPDGLRRASD